MKKGALGIKDFVRGVKQRKISVTEHVDKLVYELRHKAAPYNYFNLVTEDLAKKQASEVEAMVKTGRWKDKKLLGVPVSVKDCICVKGVESRAGSRILNNYIPTFDATVIRRLRDEGAIIIGKTAQDEFGFGSFSVNVGLDFKIPENPFDKSRCTGGSSGGSAGFTALTQFTHASLAESTGGSIAAPASFCGIAGLTPTYGRVSRYGLIDYANSLDKIGSMGKTVEDAAIMLEAITGKDEKDSTSLPDSADSYSSYVGKPVEGLKIALIKEFSPGCDRKVWETVKKAVKKLEGKGAVIDEVSLPLNSKYGIACYYLIAMAEASTNLAKFCGMRYGMHEKLEGNFNKYFSEVRSKHFGEEAKRRILLGTFARMSGFRDAYYLRAMKLRTKLIQEFKEAFHKFDLLASPAMPCIAPSFTEIKKLTPLENYAMDLCTASVNLAGLPHISVNAGFAKKMPVGLMLTADFLQEAKLVQAASAVEGVPGK